jgi:hypothetical protein
MMDGCDDPKEREDSVDRERLDYLLADRRSTQHGADEPPRKPRLRLLKSLTIIFLLVTPRPGIAQTAKPPVTSVPPDAAATASWQYGGFVDLGYLRDFNNPPNKLFRRRGTTWHVNDWHFNMWGAYAKKKPTEQSRWGTELLVHTGKDDEVFGFSATAPNIAGDEWLRLLGLANVSYLTSVGQG